MTSPTRQRLWASASPPGPIQRGVNRRFLPVVEVTADLLNRLRQFTDAVRPLLDLVLVVGFPAYAWAGELAADALSTARAAEGTRGDECSQLPAPVLRSASLLLAGVAHSPGEGVPADPGMSLAQ